MAMDDRRHARRAPITWLLFGAFIHTIPSLWFIVVTGGFAPAMALLLAGLSGSFYLEVESVFNLLWFFLPAVVYFIVYFIAALGLAAVLARISHAPWRTALVILIVAGLFAASAFPIYEIGGHNTSANYNLTGLWEAAQLPPALAWLYLTILAMLGLLLLGLQYRETWLPAGFWRRFWSRPTRWSFVVAPGLALVALFVWNNHVYLVCRPLAEAGVAQAQFCLGKAKLGTSPNRLWGDETASTWLRRAAEQGHTEAALTLGTFAGKPEDRIPWLEIAAGNGSGEAAYEIYRSLIRAYDDPEHERIAARWLVAGANAGYAEAQYALAQAIEQETFADYGITDTVGSPATLYQHAADQGHRLAREQVAGRLAIGGGGFPLDRDKAAAMFRELAREMEARGDSVESRFFAQEYRRRAERIEARQAVLESADTDALRTEALRLLDVRQPGPGLREEALGTLEDLARRGDPTAAWELGAMYIRGRHGVEKDLEQGREWWLIAADNGHLEAMERIANGYFHGNLGLTEDYTRARPYMEKLIAAYAGGLAADPREERRWRGALADLELRIERMGGRYESPVTLAPKASSGDADAQYQLASQIFGPEPVRAVELYRSAAAAGHTEANFALFSLYRFGRTGSVTTDSGVKEYQIAPKDPVKAGEHLVAAAEGHHPQAMLELALANEKGRYGIERNLVKARDQYIENINAAEQDLYGWDVDDRYVRFQKRYLEVVERILAHQQGEATETRIPRTSGS